MKVSAPFSTTRNRAKTQIAASGRANVSDGGRHKGVCPFSTTRTRVKMQIAANGHTGCPEV